MLPGSQGARGDGWILCMQMHYPPARARATRPRAAPGAPRGAVQLRTVHLPSADISSGNFSSDGTRPIHFWKAESETLRLLYRTPAAELILTFYRQINYLDADFDFLWGNGMSACNDCSQQRQPAPE